MAGRMKRIYFEIVIVRERFCWLPRGVCSTMAGRGKRTYFELIFYRKGFCWLPRFLAGFILIIDY